MLYPRALQQLFVGLYISEICIIGLLGVSIKKGPKGATGPFILMIILLIITGLFHVSLNSAISPLLDYLPKTLDAEERKAAAIVSGKIAPDNGVEYNGARDGGEAELTHTSSIITAPKHPKPNMFTKFFKPDIYSDYATMRRLMPTEVNVDEEIDPILSRDAYLAPSVWNELPRLIVPRDPAGISGHEVIETGKVAAITDAGATLDENNKMVLDEDKMSDLYFKEKEQRMGYDV
jgi:calcium permeable stress-gated cation channel